MLFFKAISCVVNPTFNFNNFLFYINSKIRRGKLKKTFLLLFCLFLNACSTMKNNHDADAVRLIHQSYVEGWLDMNEEQVMSLFEENAMIQPSSLTPLKGKKEIIEFWFPKDSSITKINSFKTDLLDLTVMDSLAIATHKSYLDWSYKKDTTDFSMVQKGISTTVYRKQQNKSWKIWRQMWTDIYSELK